MPPSRIPSPPKALLEMWEMRDKKLAEINRSCACCGTTHGNSWVYRPGEKFSAYFPGAVLCGECESRAPIGESVSEIHAKIRSQGATT